MASADELREEGNEFFRKGAYAEAKRCFSSALALTPQDALLYSNRSAASAAEGAFAEALADAEMCIKLKPTWWKGYSRKGLAEFRLMRYREAEATYKKGLEIDPENAQLKEGLKQVEDNTDQMASMQALIAATLAVQKHKKLAKYQEEDPEYTHRLTEILKQIQKNPQSLKLVMAQPDLRIKEGVIAAMGGAVEEEDSSNLKTTTHSRSTTASTAGTATNAGPATGATNSGGMGAQSSTQQPLTPEEVEAEACKQRGNEFYKQRKFTQALEAYDEACKLNPKEILYLNNRAAVFMEMGEYQKCLEECRRALEKRYELKADFSKVAKVYCRMAACYTRMGEYDEAITAYEKALTEENTRATRNCLNEVKKLKERKEREAYIDPALAEQHKEKGNEFFKSGDFPAAKKEYDEAIRRNPKDPKLYNNRAAALTKLCEYPSALKDADISVELDPQYVKGWARKGNLHVLLKEYSKALHAFEKGLAIDKDNVECLQGKTSVVFKVQQMQSSGQVDPEQVAHSLADPEIQSILRDPQMNIVLNNIQEKPESINEYLRDPKIKDAITKLITAGILRVA